MAKDMVCHLLTYIWTWDLWYQIGVIPHGYHPWGHHLNNLMVTFKLCAYHDRLWTFPIFVDIVGRIQVNNLRMCKSSIPCMDFCNLMKADKLVFPLWERKECKSKCNWHTKFKFWSCVGSKRLWEGKNKVVASIKKQEEETSFASSLSNELTHHIVSKKLLHQIHWFLDYVQKEIVVTMNKSSKRRTSS